QTFIVHPERIASPVKAGQAAAAPPAKPSLKTDQAVPVPGGTQPTKTAPAGATSVSPRLSPLEPIAAKPGIFRLDIHAATSPGCVRERNEDSFLVQQLSWSNLEERHDLAVVVVADGMGGHEAGDRAS